MQAHHQTLRTIYEIVKNDPDPETYLCRPREIILRRFEDWGIIHEHIKLLEKENLVSTKQMETMVISITATGIEELKLMLKNNETV